MANFPFFNEREKNENGRMAYMGEAPLPFVWQNDTIHWPKMRKATLLWMLLEWACYEKGCFGFPFCQWVLEIIQVPSEMPTFVGNKASFDASRDQAQTCIHLGFSYGIDLSILSL